MLCNALAIGHTEMVATLKEYTKDILGNILKISKDS